MASWASAMTYTKALLLTAKSVAMWPFHLQGYVVLAACLYTILSLTFRALFAIFVILLFPISVPILAYVVIKNEQHYEAMEYE